MSGVENWATFSPKLPALPGDPNYRVTGVLWRNKM